MNVSVVVYIYLSRPRPTLDNVA